MAELSERQVEVRHGTGRPVLDIVIVNWNSLGFLQKCLDGIRRSRRDGFELSRIIVVDNDSRDGSIAWVSAQPDCRLVINDSNRGFAAACNQGAALGHGEFLLFLNPDVVVEESTLATASGFLGNAAPDVGIVGVKLLDAGGREQRTCARFPSPWAMAGQCAGLDRVLPSIFPPHFLREWDHGDTRAVDQVMGAFFLVRRTVFEALGGFDPRFFVYFEDLDFALRARREGWKSIYLATARATHVGGGSSRRVPARRLLYFLRSRRAYWKKYFPWPQTIALACMAAIIEPVARLVQALFPGQPATWQQIGSAYWNYLWPWAREHAALGSSRSALRTQFGAGRASRALPGPAAVRVAPDAAPEVLVYTMGKVGTTTIVRGLRDVGCPVFKAHSLDIPKLRKKIAGDRRRAAVLKTDMVALNLAEVLLPRMEQVKVISLVRESIGRNMSGFFESMWKRGIKPPYDDVDVAALCRTFLEDFNHQRPEQWLQAEFGATLGIDPFSIGFDSAAGYLRFSAGKFDVLLLQLELGNSRLNDLVSDFVGRPVMLRRRNQSRNEAYGRIYQEFRQIIRFPEQFLEQMLAGNVMQHFYSAAQREHVRHYYAREVPELHPLPRC